MDSSSMNASIIASFTPFNEEMLDAPSYPEDYKAEVVQGYIIAEMKSSGKSIDDPDTKDMVHDMFSLMNDNLDYYFKIAAVTEMIENNQTAIVDLAKTAVSEVRSATIGHDEAANLALKNSLTFKLRLAELHDKDRKKLRAILKDLQDSAPMGLPCSDQLTEPPTMELTLPPTNRDTRLALHARDPIAEELAFNPMGMELASEAIQERSVVEPKCRNCLREYIRSGLGRGINTGINTDINTFTAEEKLFHILNMLIQEFMADGITLNIFAVIRIARLFLEVQKDVDKFFSYALDQEYRDPAIYLEFRIMKNVSVLVHALLRMMKDPGPVILVLNKCQWLLHVNLNLPRRF
jgi:hypothetical protein